jgi:hypothetical protein
VQPSLLFTDTLFEKIEYVVNELGKTGFNVYVHPYVEAYLKKGWLLSLASRWRRQLGSKFKIYADQSLAYLQYRVVDSEGNVLDLKQEKDTDSSSAEKTNSKVANRSEAETKDQPTAKAQSESKPAKPAKGNKNKATKASKALKADEVATEQPSQATELESEQEPQTAAGASVEQEKRPQAQKQRKQRKQRAPRPAEPQEKEAEAATPAETTEVEVGAEAPKEPVEPKPIEVKVEPENSEIKTPEIENSGEK